MRKLLARARPDLLVAAFYLALSALCYSPAFPYLSRALIGQPHGDVLRNVWGYWWVKAMLLRRWRLPAYTTYLNYPRGELILVADPLNCLLSVPFQVLLGLPAGYNVFQMVVTAFGAFSAFLLARYLTRSSAAALIAGTAYGFAPYALSAVLAGTSEVADVGWIPLFVLFLHRSLNGGSRKDGLAAGGFLICATLSSFYYGYICGVVALLYGVGWCCARLCARRPLRRGLLAAGAGVLLFALFALEMTVVYHDIIPSVQRGILRSGGEGRDPAATMANNAVNLWDVWAPQRARWDNPTLYQFPLTVLAVLPLALALAGRRGLPWAALMACTLLLAMSFHAQTGPFGRPPPPGGWLAGLGTVSHALYAAFLHLPMAGMLRFPVRFMAVANLMMAVLLALGGARLVGADGSRGQPVRVAVSVIFCLELFRELLGAANLPAAFAMTPTPVPRYVRVIAADPVPGAVANLPANLAGGMQLYDQTVHQKPLINYLDFVTARIYTYPDGRLPIMAFGVINVMHSRGFDVVRKAWAKNPPPLPSREQVRDELGRLRRHGVRWIVLDRSRFKPADLSWFSETVAPLLQLACRDGSRRLYRL